MIAINMTANKAFHDHQTILSSRAMLASVMTKSIQRNFVRWRLRPEGGAVGVECEIYLELYHGTGRQVPLMEHFEYT